jgi:hypothetical protein
MRLRSVCAWAVGVALTAAATTSCTGGDSSSDTPETSTGSTVTLTRPSKPLDVQIGQSQGVRRKDMGRVRQAIAKPIAAWIDGGFLKPSYPQSDFAGAFASWTPRAGELGQRDRDITTNAALGQKLVAIVADEQSATLYVFAHNGLTGGATARVALRFTGQMSDASLVHFVVRGDLYLTRKDSQWRIFGYRLSREVVA